MSVSFLSSWQVPLGSYPEERFDEPAPKQMIKEFQAKLSHLSKAITTRNFQLKAPYTYLNPTEIENSITIWVNLREPIQFLSSMH